jgi:hypothetical protein
METEDTFSDLFPARVVHLVDGQPYLHTPSERSFKNDNGTIRFDFNDQFQEQCKEEEGNTVYHHRPKYNYR